MNIRMESVHFTADQKLQDYIDKKLNKLDSFYNRIIDAHVILKLENTGQIRDKIVEVKLRIPKDLIVAKVSKKTFEAAVDESVKLLRRQLIRHKERQRSFSDPLEP
ncbi:MAG: ribosome-associated translation inhibitor RaiA [Saprospiraceae bacterium]|nr:ribosome-associated translation inhibitor RaiA [Saprospiraceae bacterium]